MRRFDDRKRVQTRPGRARGAVDIGPSSGNGSVIALAGLGVGVLVAAAGLYFGLTSLVNASAPAIDDPGACRQDIARTLAANARMMPLQISGQVAFGGGGLDFSGGIAGARDYRIDLSGLPTRTSLWASTEGLFVKMGDFWYQTAGLNTQIERVRTQVLRGATPWSLPSGTVVQCPGGTRVDRQELLVYNVEIARVQRAPLVGELYADAESRRWRRMVLRSEKPQLEATIEFTPGPWANPNKVIPAFVRPGARLPALPPISY